MMCLSITPEISTLVAAGSPVAIGVSGGKDSQASALVVLVTGFTAEDKITEQRRRIDDHSAAGQLATDNAGLLRRAIEAERHAAAHS